MDRNALIVELMPRAKRFALSIARRFGINDSDTIADCYCEAYAGLMRGVGKFDETRGAQPWTYAQTWVENYVIRFLRADLNSVCYVPRNVLTSKDLRPRIIAIPIPGEYESEHLPSADKLFFEHGAYMRADELDNRAELFWAIAEKTLSPRALAILHARADGGLLTDIGIPYDLTRERIRQIIAESLARIKREYQRSAP